MPGRLHSILDNLHSLRINEESAATTYQHLLATRVITPPALVLAESSHRARVGWIEVQKQRFSPLQMQDDHSRTIPIIPFTEIVNAAATDLDVIYDCERATIAWYLVLSKHAPSILAKFIANRLLPEQTRVATIVGGQARTGV